VTRLASSRRTNAALHSVHQGTHPARDSRPEQIELGGLLIHLIEWCRTQVAPGIVLGLNARLGPETMVNRREADALSFVFCEIVSNAWRYAHPAGVPVEVTAECEIGHQGEIILEIGDDGVGLGPDFAEWRDAGEGMAAVRGTLQSIGAELNLTTDDLGLRFQIILHPTGQTKPARGNFVWL
jgi:two-component sensor histidine kinase